MKTDICEILGIEYPVIQGGMAWAATAELAVAVSEAGGLGIIAAGNAPAEWVEEQVIKAKSCTDKPFGVNIMLLSPYSDEVVEVVCKHKVKVVTTGAGNPGKYVAKLKEAGTKIIPVIPSVSLAKRMEKEGADAVIAEGTEAGGHIGELTTMTLVPQVVDAVEIPVIAAGGIADGRGMAAVFALGANGVQLGTRFLCSEECIVHENYKNSIVSAKDRDAVVTGRSTGHPVRLLKNKFTRGYDNLEQTQATVSELDKYGEGSLQRAVIDGDVTNGSVMAGQIAGLIKDIKPVKSIITDLINEYNNTINRRL